MNGYKARPFLIVDIKELMISSDKLLQAQDLCRYFRLAGPLGPGAALKAVDGVSFDLAAGETLGLVGESGCGKSTLARLILALLPPSRGQVFFTGEELTRLSAERLKAMRRQMQIIFQDPYSSLNPRMTVGHILEEPFVIHGSGDQTGAPGLGGGTAGRGGAERRGAPGPLSP